MREGGRAHPLSKLRVTGHREWGWLLAGLLVTVLTLAVIQLSARYGDAFQVRAASASAAELAASRVNALEWQAIAEGHLWPGTGARVGELLASTGRNLRIAGTDAGARQVLSRYPAAIRVEFGLLAAGRIPAARRADAALVDPACRELSAVLEREAARNRQAASRVGTLADAGDIAAFVIGFGVAAGLLLRFGSARRALATAEVERRLLRENDSAENELISVVSHDLATKWPAPPGSAWACRSSRPSPRPITPSSASSARRGRGPHSAGLPGRRRPPACSGPAVTAPRRRTGSAGTASGTQVPGHRSPGHRARTGGQPRGAAPAHPTRPGPPGPVPP